ncbi:MAG: N-acyl-D-amino-acid deacylase family protein [bacterium]|jgi:N-acyl-D-amino-acid deacylase
MLDILIKDGEIYDGMGGKPFRGDIAVAGGKIVEISRLEGAQAAETIDAAGLAVAPGFIDSHSHSDPTLLANPRAESKIRQGVTTEVIGQCGSSAAPLYGEAAAVVARSYEKHGLRVDWKTLADYAERLNGNGVAVNVAPLTGQGTVRMGVVGQEERPATPEEMNGMKRVLSQAMEEGSFGLSTGLIYPPGCFTPTAELIELARVASDYGRIYVSHIRGESDTLLAAVEEAIEIGRRAAVPVQISHHKAAGKNNWGKIEQTLAMIDRARSEGINVTFDVYPYIAASTSLATLIPAWAHSGGMSALLTRLRDKATRQRLAAEIRNGIPGWENFAGAAGWENVLVVRLESAANKSLEGKTMAEIAAERGKTAEETAFDLTLEEDGETISTVLFLMREADVEMALRHPAAMIGSDSGTVATYGVLSAGRPHPRAYGTFSRVLGFYTRERRVLELPEAISKMTAKPAAKFNLRGRGSLTAGMHADIAVFDPDTVIDRATFTAPHQYAAGVKHVIVNGKMAIRDGEHTGTLAGRVLLPGVL